MVDLAQFEPYLKMSRHDPRFVNDIDYLIRTLIYYQAEINPDEYKRLLNGLNMVRDGNSSETIGVAFTWFKEIMKHGFFNLNFKEEDVRAIVQARESCAEFITWMDPAKHKPNNPWLIHYAKSLASQVITHYNEGKFNNGDEKDFWDSFDRLKRTVLPCVAKGLLYRNNLDVVAQVIKYFMQYERNIIKSLVPRDDVSIKRMNVFSGVANANILPWDIYERALYQTNLYLTDLHKFRAEVNESHQVLRRLLGEGKLNNEEYSQYNTILLRAGSYLELNVQASESDPIVAYHLGKNLGFKDESCVIFVLDEMVAARELAQSFLKNITNDYIISELIEKKLKADPAAFDHSQAIKDHFIRILTSDLGILLHYNIISEQAYANYLVRGKERFA